MGALRGSFRPQNHSSLCTNAFPACLCLGQFSLPCSWSWYFISVADGLLGLSFILAQWAKWLMSDIYHWPSDLNSPYFCSVLTLHCDKCVWNLLWQFLMMKWCSGWEVYEKKSDCCVPMKVMDLTKQSFHLTNKQTNKNSVAILFSHCVSCIFVSILSLNLVS